MNRLVPSTLLLGFLCLGLPSLMRGQTGPMEWKSAEDILGRSGAKQSGSLQALFPRTDLNVVVNGMPLEPEGLTSWFIFRPEGKKTRLVGDVVLLDREVPRTMAQALRNGLEITALYNPFLNESPGIKRLRVRGKGAQSSLAWAVKLILSSTGTPMGPSVLPLSGEGIAIETPYKGPQTALDWSKTVAILGLGKIEGRTIQFTFPSEEATPGPGVEIQGDGDPTATLFLQKTQEGSFAAMGTFVLADEKAKIVMENLIRHHITVTSFRNQGSKEEPRFFFLNFWIMGEETEVVESLKEALDQANLSPDP